MIKLVATDIDGTLTIDRASTYIPPKVVEAMRVLEEHGVLVALVSSNALPIVAGLKKYFGLGGPAIGETGAFIYFAGEDVVELSRLSARSALEDVLVEYSRYVIESWQNRFRFHDYALKIRREHRSRAREIYSMVRGFVEKRYRYVRVGFSGYAIHLTPIDTSKGRALRYVIERLGLRRDEVVAVGDSFMDAELFREAGYGVAVGNADKELVEKADIVLEKGSGEGFVELAELIIQGRIGGSL